MTPLEQLGSVPVVVTGQQAGLLGGPLFTLWKTLAAVRLAAATGARTVFWVECDDADIREADRAMLADTDGDLHMLTTDSPDDGRPVAARVVPDAIGPLLARVQALLPDGDSTHRALDAVTSAWVAGRRWPEAFAAYLGGLLLGHDVAFLDPSTAAFKAAAAPFFSRVLDADAAVEVALAAGTEAVANPQVPYVPGELPLFLIDDDGRRRKIERRAPGFGLKGSERRFSRTELAALLGAEPERFSAAVLLRPVLQDYLLATVAYVAGPAEARYHEQIGPLYDLLEVTRPRLVRRPHVTLVEPRARRALEKLGATLRDVTDGEAALLERASVARAGVDPTAAGEATLERIQGELGRLRERLEPIEPGAVGPAFAEAEAKVAHQVRRAAARAAASLARRDQEAAAHARRAASLLRPGGEPQERVFVPLQFLCRYPSDAILDPVLAAIDIERSGQEITIEL